MIEGLGLQKLFGDATSPNKSAARVPQRRNAIREPHHVAQFQWGLKNVNLSVTQRSNM